MKKIKFTLLRLKMVNGKIFVLEPNALVVFIPQKQKPLRKVAK